MSTRSASLTIPVGRTVTRCHSGEPGAYGGGKGNRDRVYSQQKERVPSGEAGARAAGPARRWARAGVHSVGNGALWQLETVARQKDAPDIPEASGRQMPALRRLFHRSGSGAVLRTRAHVVSVPFAGLLQWTQLSSPTVKPAPDRVSCAGQRLRLDCRLGAGPEVSGPLLGENGAPQAGPVR